MSYSFSVVAETKAEAKAKVAAEFDKIVESQPVHAADRETALATASAFVDHLVDPSDDQVIRLSVNGSLGWRAEGEFTSAAVGVQAYLTRKE